MEGREREERKTNEFQTCSMHTSLTSSSHGLRLLSSRMSKPRISKHWLFSVKRHLGRQAWYEWTKWGCASSTVLMITSWGGGGGGQS